MNESTATTRHEPRADTSAVESAVDSSLLSLTRDLCGMSHFYEEGNEGLRVKLLAKARALSIALETPTETMMRQCWAEVCSSSLS